MTSYTTKQSITSKIQYKSQASNMDRENRNGARGDTEMIPVVPFLCKKVRLRWRGVTATKASQRHKGLTLFSGDPRHKGLGHVFH